MKNIYGLLLILAVAAALGCAGQQQEAAEDGGFDASICNNIPVGVEALAASDPENKEFSISCADLERCTSIMNWDAPPDIPCTGP